MRFLAGLPYLRLSIWAQIAVLGALMALATVGVFLWITIPMADATVEHEQEEHLEWATTLANHIGDDLGHIFHMGEQAASALALPLERGDLDGMRRELQSYYVSVALAEGVAVVDREGTVVAAEPSFLDWPDVAEQPFFQQLLSTGEWQVSGALEVPNGGLLMALALPIPGPGGAPAGAMLTFGIPERLVHTPLAYQEPGEFLLVDMEGAVTAREWPGTEYARQEHIAGLNARLASATSGVGTCYTCHEGGRREEQLMSFVRLEAAPSWALVTMTPVSEAMAWANRLDRILLLGGGLLLAVLGGLLLFGTWVWVSRLALLSRLSQRMAAGALDEPVPFLGRDEVGALARDFEAMRLSLREERRSLEERVEDRTRELSGLLAIDRAISLDRPMEESLAVALEHAVRTVAADAGGIYVLSEAGDLELQVHRGFSPEFAQAVRRLRVGEGAPGRAAELRHPVAMSKHDVPDGSPLAALLDREVHGPGAGAPMLVGERLLGAVVVCRQKEVPFTEHELNLLGSMASQLAQSYERSRLLRELEQANEELAAELAERERGQEALQESERRAVKALEELKATQESLVQAEKLSAIGELVAGAAHELNNPLTGVLGFSQLLLRADLAPEVRQDVERIASEAGRAARVVQNLVSFARRQEVQAGPVDIVGVVLRVLEIKAYDLRVSNIQVETDFQQDVAKVMGDVSQLQSVVLNLINNAQDAMAETRGRGTLRIETARIGRKVRVIIADDGPGIKPEHLHRVFDPFFTTKPVGRGAGLGLSICHGIVTGHNGRIWVESKYGKGATFHVELPVAPEERDEGAEGETVVQAAAPAGGRILVIDDEPVIRALLKAALSGDTGCQVDTLASAREAMASLESADYDLLLVDLKMPDMDGKEFFRLLVQKAPKLASRVVFVTGDTVSADTQGFLESTGRPVVAKPFDLEALRRLVAEELAKASQG